MFHELKEKLQNYDLMHLLTYNSACQLMPENADKLMRFEAIAHCICSNNYSRNRPKISKSHLRRIYNTDLCSELRKIAIMLEDPFEQMFTESISFYGGSYVVLPGITECGSLIVRSLLKAIFQSHRYPEYYQFYEEAYQTALLLLTFSNQMAKKAGLQYGQKSRVTKKDIELPSIDMEERLFNAVTFKADEVKLMLTDKKISEKVFRNFVVKMGDINFEDYTPDNHKLHQCPFVEVEDKIIVAMPCNIIATLRHSLITLAIKHNFIAHLRNNFENVLWDKVLECADIIKMAYLDLPFPQKDEKLQCKEGLFTIDTDKLMYVQLHTDDFSDYDARIVFDNGFSIDNEKVEKRVIKIKEHINKELPHIKEVLVIFLLQTAGRSIFLGLSESIGKNFLAMSVNDLETIAYLEGGDPLHLYKYAKAYRRLNSFEANFLDPYSTYRSNDKSFYLSDDKRPDIIYFSVGQGREVIEEMNDKIGLHGVPLPNYRGIADVVSLYGSRSIPIFTRLRSIGREVALVVEGASWIIWIRCSVCHSVSARFVDMVAYWIWQSSEVLNKLLKDNIVLDIEINLYPYESWYSQSDQSNSTENEDSVITCDITNDKILVNVHYDFSKKLIGPTNNGERELIKKILQAILKFTHTDDVFHEIDVSIDKIAPLGPKKKLLVFDHGHYSILLEPGEFPTLRFIDSADENEILDSIGLFVSEEKKLKVGEVENPTELIKSVVGFLFSEIEKIIATIKDPENLISTLMLYYEALLHKREEHRLTITTTLHCFSNEEEMIKKLNDDTNKFNKLSTSLRFIIEYVSACPPQSGTRLFSLELFDMLLALSAQLIQWANTSDLIYYKLANLKVSMLPSKRLGIGNREGYESASVKFLTEYSSETLSSAISYFESHWNGNLVENAKEVDEDFIVAFEKEFGIGFYEFFDFIAAMIDEGREISNEVKSYSLQELKATLIKKYHLSEEIIDRAINLLSLQKRKEFLKPPKGFRSEDIFPWKFNRELSYIRRPLIVWDEKIYWTNRHLYYCGRHLIDLCLGGRLNAKTKEMKRLISKYQNIHGHDFNKKVVELFSSFDHLIVKSQVKKLGKLKIVGENGELGDIDVLIIDPNKRRIYTIECKDLSIARNPYEIHHELNNLFYGANGKPSIMEKHLKRTSWVENHLIEILEHFKIMRTEGKWKVKPLIVIDEAMISPYLYKEESKVRIISYNKLRGELEEGIFFKK